MKSLKYAKLGSISSGTLRTADVLSAFISALEGLILINGEYYSQPEKFVERDALANLIGEAQDAFNEDTEDVANPESASILIEQLQNNLEDFAPPYCYFGTADGDGADFGFWPSHDSIEELPHAKDKEDGEDYKEVNDHGNVTIFSADGSVLLELV